MKILEFLACLSWLLLPAFAKFRPFAPLPSQSPDHPERMMEQSGQLDCLGHNLHDLDILRRFEAPLYTYPEVRVGCETFSVKPFRPSSQSFHKRNDPLAWLFNDKDKEEDYKVPPRNFNQLEDAVVKYFVIDMYGVETTVGPGSTVTVEIYDFSQVYISRKDFMNESTVSDLPRRHETFTFDQLCFPSVCYRPGEKKPEACRNDTECFTAVDIGSSLVECASLPGDECNFLIGHTADVRRNFKGKSVGSVFSSNISTYCSLETSNGPLLGPLRTSNYPGLPAVLSSCATPRYQVSSASEISCQTSGLLSRHLRTVEYKGQSLITSCYVFVPMEVPFNKIFVVDFFVAEDGDSDEKQIIPGQQLMLNSNAKGDVDVALEVKFEDLCFPAECYEEPPPLDDAKCQLRRPNGPPPPGGYLGFLDPTRGIAKMLWPTQGCYKKL